MTLSEIATLCPAPEGMEWKEPDKNQFVLVTTESGVAGSVDISNPDDDEPDAYVSLTGNGCHYQAFPALLDLPAAYLRALAAVGLAPDAEKEDMRRRLTWTEEVPTTPGRYLVDEPGKETTCWSLLEDERWSHSSWATFVLGLVPFTDSARFLPLSNLKET